LRGGKDEKYFSGNLSECGQAVRQATINSFLPPNIMQEYLFIFRMDAAVTTMEMPADQVAVIQAWQSWIGQLAGQGKFVSTQQLLPQGKVVSGGGKVITDGPHIEAKELVGGDMVVKAASLDEAVELAKGCPVLAHGGKVEVRAIMPAQALQG
jgi:hypothetical protein